MPRSEPRKIVYLFGAGATHAELTNIEPTLLEEEAGLLVKNVSARVIERARRNAAYRDGLETVSSTSGSLNIELLIGLIESSNIHGWESKTQRLRKLVQKDIEAILTELRTSRFYLHKALFEFHKHRLVRPKEKLIGLISLNYDEVLDQAFEEVHGTPNYCLSLDSDAPVSKQIPLLKLHGSFNWSSLKIRGRKRTIEIIPFGSHKEYLHPPYGFIWNRALEILIECDVLRVIGCSLSQNDTHLIDLIFKAHLEKGNSFDMEIISSEQTGQDIRKNYGFFPQIKTLVEIEGRLIPVATPENAFKTWLRYKSHGILSESIKRTKYLKILTT